MKQNQKQNQTGEVRRPDQGLFVSIEGIDGAGKSTIVELLTGRIMREQETYYPDQPIPIWTRSPSPDSVVTPVIRSFLSEEYREESREETLLLSGERTDTEAALFLLFMADRALHQHWLRPHYEDGRIIISDRYHLSTLAYQSVTHAEVERLVPNLLVPDLTILLDISIDTALNRIGKRRREVFENRYILETVRQAYLDCVDDVSWRVEVVDAEADSPAVLKSIWDILKDLLKEVWERA